MIDTKQMTDTTVANVDKFFATAGNAFQGVEQLTALNLQVSKTLLAEMSENTMAMLSARSPEEMIRLQTRTMQDAPAKAAAYANQVKAIVESSFAGQRLAAEEKIAEVQAQFVASVADLLKNAPGSENALALVKSAVAASNDAYAGVNKAGKQMADAVEAKMGKLATGAAKASRAA